jgi:N-ethylmaleimide reductase
VPTIWDPVDVGRLTLKHRLAMAPMTRNRADPDGTPGPLAAEYYAQRASFGLLISEGTQPSDDGQGYPNTPGIYTDRHVAGWRKVVSAVHGAGGHLFIQLMHAGRMSHPDNTPHHRPPVAPSPVSTGEKMFTGKGMLDAPTPRALSVEEVKATIRDFRHAAARAIEAGADGVEIHAGNGYLLQQFFSPNANLRSDGYGGSIANRARFGIEVAAAVADEIGAVRTGFRISPGSRLGGINEGEDYPDFYAHLVGELAGLGLAYLHVAHGGNDALLREFRRLWPTALLVNRGGRPLEAVGTDIEAGLADVAPVARWALANPDFVERLRAGVALNAPDKATFYGGGARGYTDYPRFGEVSGQRGCEGLSA